MTTNKDIKVAIPMTNKKTPRKKEKGTALKLKPRGVFAAPEDQRRKTISFVHYEEIQRCVGRDPSERLTWALKFAERDLNLLMPGDWERLRWELWAFTVTLVWWDALPKSKRSAFRFRFGDLSKERKQPTTVEAHDFPEIQDVRQTHEQFTNLLVDLAQNGVSFVGPISYQLVVPWLGSQEGRIILDALHATGSPENKMAQEAFGNQDYPIEYPLSEFRDYATSRFAELITGHGNLVRICPEEQCARWFVAGRANQDFCGSRCQMRAATRKYRTGKSKGKARRER